MYGFGYQNQIKWWFNGNLDSAGGVAFRETLQMFGMFGVWLKSNRTNLLEDENRSKLNSAHPHPSCLVLSVLRLPKVFCVERKNWSQWEKMWLIQLPLHGFLGISNLPIKKSVYFSRSIFYLIWRPRLEPRSRKTWRQPSSGFVWKGKY